MNPQYQGVLPNRVVHQCQTEIDDIRANDAANGWRGIDDYFSKKHAERIRELQRRISKVVFT